jgi:hypothetical protein
MGSLRRPAGTDSLDQAAALADDVASDVENLLKFAGC